MTQQTASDVRFGFVELLFALAVGQVAIHAADVIGAQGTWVEKVPAIAHLAVGLILISASWVGWKRSKSPGLSGDVQHLFSREFVGLLLDVILVVLYFIIVRSVELEQSGGTTKLSSPSARPESTWLIVVFVVYAIWDLITDVFSTNCLPKAKPLKSCWNAFRAAVVSTITSLTCVLLCYMTLINADAASPVKVVALDVMLLCVVLLFRLLKRVENVLSRWFSISDYAAFRPREVGKFDMFWTITLSITYGLTLLLVSGVVPCEAFR